MKEKLLVVACAVAVLSSAAAVAASLAVRARAAEPAAPEAAAVPSDTALKILAQDAETRVYSFHSEGHLCFVASTRGGSGVSITCAH